MRATRRAHQPRTRRPGRRRRAAQDNPAPRADEGRVPRTRTGPVVERAAPGMLLNRGRWRAVAPTGRAPRRDIGAPCRPRGCGARRSLHAGQGASDAGGDASGHGRWGGGHDGGIGPHHRRCRRRGGVGTTCDGGDGDGGPGPGMAARARTPCPAGRRPGLAPRAPPDRSGVRGTRGARGPCSPWPRRPPADRAARPAAMPALRRGAPRCHRPLSRQAGSPRTPLPRLAPDGHRSETAGAPGHTRQSPCQAAMPTCRNRNPVAIGTGPGADGCLRCLPPRRQRRGARHPSQRGGGSGIAGRSIRGRPHACSRNRLSQRTNSAAPQRMGREPGRAAALRRVSVAVSAAHDPALTVHARAETAGLPAPP